MYPVSLMALLIARKSVRMDRISFSNAGLIRSPDIGNNIRQEPCFFDLTKQPVQFIRPIERNNDFFAWAMGATSFPIAFSPEYAHHNHNMIIIRKEAHFGQYKSRVPLP